MTALFRNSLLGALFLLALTIPAIATDFGKDEDIKQVRSAVAGKFGKVLHVSVSNDWALATAYSETDESDLSIVLRRTGKGWKITQSDGGAFDKTTLTSLGVPPADIAALLKAYQ